MIMSQKTPMLDDLSLVTVQAEDGTREYHNVEIIGQL